MFGKLFGRDKPKRDQLGFEVSELGVPTTETSVTLGRDTTVTPGAETTITTTTTHIPGVPQLDLQAILATVKAAQQQTGGDREALARMLRERFAGAGVSFDEASALDWSAMPGQDPIALLATLTELHEKGVVDDEQFEAQKRRLLGSG